MTTAIMCMNYEHHSIDPSISCDIASFFTIALRHVVIGIAALSSVEAMLMISVVLIFATS